MSKRTSPLAEIGDVVTDGLTDAWSATTSFAQDLASSAAEAASGLGAVATGGLSDGTDRLLSLYEQGRQHVRPRRRTNPWWYVGAALVAAVGVGWWLRRRRSSTTSDQAAVSPVARFQDTARAAAGN